MFRNQIRGKRQQEQQDDLRGWLIATPAAEKTQGATVQPADNKPSQIPPIATLKNSTVAPPTVNTIVPIATATANLSETKAGGVVH